MLTEYEGGDQGVLSNVFKSPATVLFASSFLRCFMYIDPQAADNESKLLHLAL